MKKNCCSVVWLFVFGIVAVLPVSGQPPSSHLDPSPPQLNPNCTSTMPTLLEDDGCDFWKLLAKLFLRIKWDQCDCDQEAVYSSTEHSINETAAPNLQQLQDHFLYIVECVLKADVDSVFERITEALQFNPGLTIDIISTFVQNCFEDLDKNSTDT